MKAKWEIPKDRIQNLFVSVTGPGRPQGALLYETIIEHVAALVKRPADAVRETNFFDWEGLDKHSGGKVTLLMSRFRVW